MHVILVWPALALACRAIAHKLQLATKKYEVEIKEPMSCKGSSGFNLKEHLSRYYFPIHFAQVLNLQGPIPILTNQTFTPVDDTKVAPIHRKFLPEKKRFH